MATMHEGLPISEILAKIGRDYAKTIDQDVMRALLGNPTRELPGLAAPRYSLSSPPYIPREERKAEAEEVRTLNFPVWRDVDFGAAAAEAEAEIEKAAVIKAGRQRDERIDLVIADLQANRIGAKKIQLLVDAIACATTDAKLLRAIGR